MSDEYVDLHLAHLESAGRPQSTIIARRDVLRRLNARLDFGLVYAATEQIEAWFAELRRAGRARATLALYGYHAHQFYVWACNAGILDGDPTATIKRPKVPRGIPNPITEDELAALLELPEPVKTAVILGAFEGQRRSEIAACWREHITEETTLIPHGKGDKPGTVPTHPFVWAHVKDRAAGPLILSESGRPMSSRRMADRCRVAFDGIGLTDVHLHRLRHRFGTVIQELYGDLRLTQECMRHESVNSTVGYTLVTNKRRTAAVVALPVPKTAGPASH